MFTVYPRRTEVVELEIREAGTRLVKASPFDISPPADTAPQKCGTLQLVIHHVKDAGIFVLLLVSSRKGGGESITKRSRWMGFSGVLGEVSSTFFSTVH